MKHKIKKIKKHPFKTALIVTFIGLFIFGIYIYSSSSRGSGVPISMGDKIAVLEIKGVLLSSREIIEHIHAAKKNEDIKGVVLRINSPGGGVSPSQEIYSEVKKLAGSKKVVASFSSIAASGGYYIACAADKIVSNPGSLTGSIGVVMDFSNVQGLLEKLGLKNYVIKSGKYKDIGSPARDMTNDEKEVLQRVIDTVHNQFVDAVAEGRGRAKEDVNKIADGRIFSGEQALDLGLVDALGNLQDAIRLVSEMAGIKGEPKVFYMEKKKGIIDYLLGESVKTAIDNLFMPQLMYTMERF